MAKKIVFTFQKNKGKIIGFGNFKDLEDGNYTIYKQDKIRSPEQNRLYWGYYIKVIVMQYKENGYIVTKDEIHKKFKKAFLRYQERSDFNPRKYVWKTGSTTNLNPKQFKEFIENIKLLCEFGKLHKIPGLDPLEPFIIEEPNEKQLLEWIDKIV